MDGQRSAIRSREATVGGTLFRAEGPSDRPSSRSAQEGPTQGQEGP